MSSQTGTGPQIGDRSAGGWAEAKGGAEAFDGTCGRFFQPDYKALEDEVLKAGLADGPAQAMFDFIDRDEGRSPRFRE